MIFSIVVKILVSINQIEYNLKVEFKTVDTNKRIYFSKYIEEILYCCYSFQVHLFELYFELGSELNTNLARNEKERDRERKRKRRYKELIYVG